MANQTMSVPFAQDYAEAVELVDRALTSCDWAPLDDFLCRDVLIATEGMATRMLSQEVASLLPRLVDP